MASRNNDSIWPKLPLKDDDIVIASTIKSGTTWLQQIVAQLVFEGKFKDNLNNVSIWVDTLRTFSEDEIITKLENQTHRRFVKTHSPSPIVLNHNNNNVKYIFITRDFRDVVWSFYNHFTNSKIPLDTNDHVGMKLKKSNDHYEFWKNIIDHDHLFEKTKQYSIIWSYFNTVKTWLNENHRDNVLILHFNDLKKDLKGHIHKISDFLGYKYNNDVINKIYQKCTFEWMKNNHHKVAPNNFAHRNSNFINKGTNKRWANTLTNNDIDEYNRIIKKFFDENTINWIENGSHHNIPKFKKIDKNMV